ncbi:MAG: hypothetical protein IPJ85_00635 [Flavobacteriales bacterium]|nr:hypothetical protein [Flavobacteriales bacterium]
MPSPRWGSGTFVTNGLAFVVGGRSNGIDYPQMWAYDPITNTWAPKAEFPGTPRRLATVFATNGKGYYGCGITGSGTFLSDFWEYDPVANTWTQKANFPPGQRYNTWQFVLNGIAYVGGGNSAGASGPFHADAFKYDPNTDTWSTAAAIPDQGRHGAVGFTMNGKGYVVGGRENSLNFVQDLWSFDPTSNAWSAMTPFPGAPRSSPLAFVYCNDAVVGCGRDGSVNHHDAWAYSAMTNSWSQIPSYPGATAMAGTSFSIGNRAYGGLGWDLTTDLSHADLWELIKPGNVSVAEQITATNILISPNPAGRDGFRIESRASGFINASLLTCDGRMLDNWHFQQTFHVPTDQLEKGAYLITWIQGETKGTARIIIH